MTRALLLVPFLLLGCADAPPPIERAVPPQNLGPQPPDAALFLRCAIALAPNIDPADDSRRHFEAAVLENDYDGPEFSLALETLNEKLVAAGHRPLRRPLPKSPGQSHGP